MWAVMAQSVSAVAVEITAHRGASRLAPENTLGAVELGWQLGADSVEIDVYLTKDNRIVAIHDDDTKRTAGVSLVVAETNFDRLRELDVGRWKSPSWAGQRIPSLEELLPTIPDGKRLLIEVKCGPEIVPVLKDALKKSGVENNKCAVICFKAEVLLEVKRQMPHMHVQWLVGTIPERDKETKQIRVNVDEVVASCLRGKFDGLSVKRDSAIDVEFVKKFHDAGLQLHVWTVNSSQEAKRLAGRGVDAITTDQPGRLRQELAGR
jgi:glycerophosphoryl diester phosphodiesterase